MGKPEVHYEALVSHLEDREWSEVQIANLAHMSVTASVMSLEGILRILKYQREIDENIAAEKQADRVFVPGVPESFFEDTQSSEHLRQRFGDIL